jgi:hypothetical protein
VLPNNSLERTRHPLTRRLHLVAYREEHKYQLIDWEEVSLPHNNSPERTREAGIRVSRIAVRGFRKKR